MQIERTNLRLRTVSVNHWHHRFIYISATGLSGKWCVWNPLKFFPLTGFQFFSSHSKHAMPFQQQHSFYRWGNLWALAVDIDQLYVTANLLMNVRTCFYWNQMTVASVMCPPVLEVELRIYSDKRNLNKFSTFASQDCALQRIWAPLDSSEASSCRPLFFAVRVAQFENLKVCINSFSQFLHVTYGVRRFSLL